MAMKAITSNVLGRNSGVFSSTNSLMSPRRKARLRWKINNLRWSIPLMSVQSPQKNQVTSEILAVPIRFKTRWKRLVKHVVAMAGLNRLRTNTLMFRQEKLVNHPQEKFVQLMNCRIWTDSLRAINNQAAQNPAKIEAVETILRVQRPIRRRMNQKWWRSSNLNIS